MGDAGPLRQRRVRHDEFRTAARGDEGPRPHFAWELQLHGPTWSSHADGSRKKERGRGGEGRGRRQPDGWVNSHIRRYVETDGRKGHKWYGLDTLLLTTRGRRSGKLRRTALIYGTDSDGFVVVGSNGGARKHPTWYVNLLKHPEVEVQVGAEKFLARARGATGEERARLWRMMASLFPQYDSYQKKTSREIRS